MVMKFLERKRQKPPTIIIISLIDILIVLLIFMMVTTTFKQRPVVNLSLPQSSSEASTQIESESVIVSITAEAPHVYLNDLPMAEAALDEALRAIAQKNASTTVIVRSDQEAPVKELVRVMDSARSSGLKQVKLRTEPAQ